MQDLKGQAALVTGAKSEITKVSDLKGKRVAVTRGTDPHIFLVRSLADAGLTEKAREAAEFLGLAFERKFTGYGDLSPALQRADTMLEPPNS